MKSIKGKGRLIKLIASKISRFNKSRFINYISNGSKLTNLSKAVRNNNLIDVEIVSFSSSHDFGEQVLSILSFIKHVGIPASWTLYSDGTHSSSQIKQLESAFDFLKLLKTDFDSNYIRENINNILSPYQKEFIDYANKLPLGKKLFFYLNFPIVKPTIFLDSDVLFYQEANCLSKLVGDSTNGWFLPDADWGNLDSRYTSNVTPQLHQVNSGLIVMNKELTSLSKGLEFFRSLNGKYEYFSEQTILHILLLENDFKPLNSNIFTLNSGDQFSFSYLYQRESIAVRHYTSPVRHKMWQRDWKWHLSIS